jgi:glycine oxidase
VNSGDTDVVVIGGGAIGLAVANALLRATLRVTSIYPPATDDRPVASRAAGAMLGAFGEITSDDGGTDDPAFQFRLEAQRMYPEWLDGLRQQTGQSVHQGSGTYVVANNVGLTDRASLHRMKQRADAVGEPAEYVDPNDIPGLRPNQYQAPGLCLHLPNEGSVDPDQLLGALEVAAENAGSWSRIAEVVLSVRPAEGGWEVTTVGGQMLRTHQVVLCAGSRSWEVLDKDLCSEAGLPDLYFGKGVSCLVRNGPPIRSTIRTPNRAFACGIHVVPRPDGLLYLGATNNLGVDHDIERGIQPGELHNLFDEVLHQINGDLRQSRIESLRVGFRPIAAHGRPVLGKTRLPGLSVATGTYRDGLLMAPLVAAIVAAEVTGRSAQSNPFPVVHDEPAPDPGMLVDVGIRDVVSFLQEPRGELPYDRAEQLRGYITALFHMAIDDDDGRFSPLRDEIRRRLREVPLNETMHGIFRDLADNADTLDPPHLGTP